MELKLIFHLVAAFYVALNVRGRQIVEAPEDETLQYIDKECLKSLTIRDCNSSDVERYYTVTNFFMLDMDEECRGIYYYEWSVTGAKSETYPEYVNSSMLIIEPNNLTHGNYTITVKVSNEPKNKSRTISCGFTLSKKFLQPIITAQLKSSTYKDYEHLKGPTTEDIYSDCSLGFEDHNPTMYWYRDGSATSDSATRLTVSEDDVEKGISYQFGVYNPYTRTYLYSKKIYTSYTPCWQSAPICLYNCPCPFRYYDEDDIMVIIKPNVAFYNGRGHEMSLPGFTPPLANELFMPNIGRCYTHSRSDYCSLTSSSYNPYEQSSRFDVWGWIPIAPSFAHNIPCTIRSSPTRALDIYDIRCKRNNMGVRLDAVYRLEQESLHAGMSIVLASNVVPVFKIRLSYNGDIYLFLVTHDLVQEYKVINPKPTVKPFATTCQSVGDLIIYILDIWNGESKQYRSPKDMMARGEVFEAQQILHSIFVEMEMYRRLHAEDVKSLKVLNAFSIEMTKNILQNAVQHIPKALYYYGLSLVADIVTTPKELTVRHLLSKYCLDLARICTERIGHLDLPFPEKTRVCMATFDRDYKRFKTCAEYVLADDGVSSTSKKLSVTNITELEWHQVYGDQVITDSLEEDDYYLPNKEQLVDIQENTSAFMLLMSTARIRLKVYRDFESEINDDYGSGYIAHFSHACYDSARTTCRPPDGGLCLDYGNNIHYNTINRDSWEDKRQLIFFAIRVHLAYVVEPQQFFVGMDMHVATPIVTMYADQKEKGKAQQSDLLSINKPFNLGFLTFPEPTFSFYQSVVYFSPKTLPLDSSDFLIVNLTVQARHAWAIDFINSTNNLKVVIKPGVPPKFEDFSKATLVGRINYTQIFNQLNDKTIRFYIGIIPEGQEKGQRATRADNKNKNKSKGDGGDKGKDKEQIGVRFSFKTYTSKCKQYKNRTWSETLCTMYKAVVWYHCICSEFDGIAVVTQTIPINYIYPSYQPEYVKPAAKPLSLILFNLEFSGCILIYIAMGAVFGLYFLAWMFVLFRRPYPVPIYYLSDNVKDDRFVYMVEVTTGDGLSAGTTSNITIKIYGSDANSQAHVLNYPDPDLKLLQSGNEDYFVLTTRSHLGNLKRIELWCDFISVRPSWVCDRVRICDMQVQRWWNFYVQKRLTPLRDDRFCLSVEPLDEEEHHFKLHPFRIMFGSEHTWNIISPTNQNNLTYVEKINIILAQILCACGLSVAICANPMLKLSDSRELTEVTVNYIVWHSILIAVISFSSTLVFVIFFRFTARRCVQSYICREKPWPMVFRFIAWGVLVTLIAVCTLYLLIFSIGISHSAGLVCLAITFFAIIVNMMILENLYLFVILNLKNRMVQNDVALCYNAITLEIENQRAVLSRVIGGSCFLRPYLIHLYMPVLKDKRTRKRCEVLQKLKQEGAFFYVLFISLYIVALHVLLAVNTDAMMAYQTTNLRTMVNGLHRYVSNSSLALSSVYSFAGLLIYMNKTLAPTLNCYEWYPKYKVIDPQLMADFHTKYVSKPRLRQIKTRPVYCRDRKFALQLNTTKCFPLYTRKHEDQTRWGGGVLFSYFYSNVTGERTVRGELASYYAGGFITHLFNTLDGARNRLNQIKKIKWLDRHTRAVIIEFLTFNNNHNIISAVTVLFEITATGLTFASYQISSHRFFYPDSTKIVLYNAFFYFYIALVSYYVITALFEALMRKRQYRRARVGILNFALFFASIAQVYLMIQRDRKIEDFVRFLNSDQYRLLDYFELIDYADWSRILGAVQLSLLILSGSIFLKIVAPLNTFLSILTTRLFISACILHIIVVNVLTCVALVLYNGFLKQFSAWFPAFQTIALLPFSRRLIIDDMMAVSPIGTPIFCTVYVYCKLYVFSTYVAAFYLSYKESENSFVCAGVNYTLLDYIKDQILFFGQYCFRRLKYVKLAAGKGSANQCDQVYINPNKRRYEGYVVVKDSKMKAMIAIVLGLLYNKYIRQTSRTNQKDMLIMENIVMDYCCMRNEGRSVAYYQTYLARDQRAFRYFISESTLHEMEMIAHRVLNPRGKKKFKAKKKDEYLTDLISFRRLCNIEAMMLAVDYTLTILLGLETNEEETAV